MEISPHSPRVCDLQTERVLSEEVGDLHDAVVDVLTSRICAVRIADRCVVCLDRGERIVDKTVTGLETDLRLEGVLTNCTDHL